LAANPDTKNGFADFKCAGVAATIRGDWHESITFFTTKAQP
jgi:hypothetical protein